MQKPAGNSLKNLEVDASIIDKPTFKDINGMTQPHIKTKTCKKKKQLVVNEIMV